jgi:hypothetical protein
MLRGPQDQQGRRTVAYLEGGGRPGKARPAAAFCCFYGTT